MLRRGQVELPSFDPKQERTLHWLRRELREAQQRNLATMQKNEGHDQDQEQYKPEGGHNGNNGRNHAPMLFIQPDDPFMLLAEFALPPIVLVCYPKTTHSSEQLRAEISDLADASEHSVPRIAK